MSVGWALSWELWARQRWLLRITAVYLILVILLGLTLPEKAIPYMLGWLPDQMVRDLRPGVREKVIPYLIGWLLVPLVCVVVVTVAGLCRGLEGKYEGPDSLLPGRLLVLPVSARALVTWSILAGAVPVSLLWPILALGLRWLGASVPLVWPALLVFNVVAWLQALSYVPFGVPYLRLWLAGLGVPGLIGATCAADQFGVPGWVLAALLIGLGLAAYGLAVAGVKQARHSAVSGWTGWWPRPISARWVEEKPFTSPSQALFWMEWRLLAWKFLFAAGLALFFMLPVLYMATRALEDTALVEVAGLAPAVRAVGPGWLALTWFLWVPFLFVVIGCEGGQVQVGTHGVAASFVLVRPVHTLTLVTAKLWACACGALVCVLLLLPAGLGWALPTGRWVEMSDRLIALSGSGWAAVLVLLGGLGGLFAVTWGQMAAGLWVRLSGRMWVVTATVGVTVAGITGMAILVTQVATEPAWRDEAARRLPTVLAWVIAFKVGLTIVVFGENIRRGFLSARTVLLALGAWGLVAAGLFAELAWLVPVETVARTTLALSVALLLPIARIGLAPLALNWNRHR